MTEVPYSLQRRLAWRLGLLFLGATAVITAGLFVSAYDVLDAPVGIGGAVDAEAREEFMHALFREYFGDVFVLLVPFIGVVLLVGYFTLAGAFRSVSALSQQAAAIEPPATGVRLPMAGVPAELKPLIAAVNDALNRLEQGFTTQRQFLANAAHQLRTPLAALSARIDDLHDPQRADETATAIQGDVRRLNRLVNQLLKIARFASQPFEMSAVDLRAIAQETVAFLAPLAIRKGRSLSLAGTTNTVNVHGNAAAIGDALANLIENALEHAPEGSEVEVEVRDTGEVRVLDHGPGIPEEFRGLAFERFWRGSGSRYEGSGLGLSIVAEVAQQHDASVNLEGRPGGGTVAALRFRAANAL